MHACFETTRWTTVLRAKDPADPRWRQAMDALCRDYEQPLLLYIVSRTACNDERAHELAQSFMAKLLERGVTTTEPSRGTFRLWLRLQLHQYLVEWAPSSGGDLSEASAAYPSQGLPAERVFDRSWALTLVGRASDQLSQHAVALAHPERYLRVRGLLLGSVDDAARDAAIAEELGIEQDTLRSYVSLLQSLFAQMLREEVSRLVHDEAVIDEELTKLVCALTGSSAQTERMVTL